MPSFARAPRAVRFALPLLAAFSAAVTLSSPARSARAEEVVIARTISVVGHGETKAAPDVLRADLGVETRAREIGEAVRQNDAAMTRVIAALDQQGITAQDRQTIAYSVEIERSPQGAASSGDQRTVRVFNQVHVTIHNLGRASDVLQAAVDAGANSVASVRLGVTDERALASAARERAVGAARRDADAMARAAGVQLGSVISMSEAKQGVAVPRARLAAASEDEGPPIETGQLSVSADVTMVFGLTNNAPAPAEGADSGANSPSPTPVP